MYHPDRVAARIADILASPVGKALGGSLDDYTVHDCRYMETRLDGHWDGKKARQTKALTPEEQRFVTHARVRGKVDYRWWAERFSKIIHPARGITSIYPLFESQRLALEAIGKRERALHQTGHPDGILGNVLKGRQMGISTLAQSILAHRATTQSYTQCLIASDVPENSGSTGLFGKLEFTVEHVPWWMKPGELGHVKSGHIHFTNHSRVNVESGKSMKGGLQDKGGSKGQLGRSKTYSMIHLSELSTWENPEQIDDSLDPAIPQTSRTFALYESTAKGRHNWWHRQWNAAARGKHPRFFNIFIPWYAEKGLNWLPIPPGWVAPDYAVQYAQRVATHSAAFMGSTIRLTTEQLVWYCARREVAIEKGQLFKFLEEYPAEPEEAFQHSGRSVFPPQVLDQLRNETKPLAGIWEVLPTTVLGGRTA